MEKLKLGVIGDPIGHTLSPAIQGAIAEKLGQPCSYEAFHVPLKGLPDFVGKARRCKHHQNKGWRFVRL